MYENMKNELGHKYGPYLVTEYTPLREHSNGCVKWKIKCTCGYEKIINGNNLRFHMGCKLCPECGRRD